MNIQAYSEISERIKSARKAIENCHLCPRSCGVNRIAGEKGFCGLDDSTRVFQEFIFNGEERELNPSHQIHFTGCNLKCEFCPVNEWNREPGAAKKTDFVGLAKVILQRQREGAKTLNILGGEPCVNLYGILELLGMLKPEITLVWNSNMFYNEIVDELISGLIDIYLADLKCGNDECAEKLLGSAEYLMTAKKNILSAFEKADVIVRHIVLPGHRHCCLEPILKWIAAEIPNVKLSLRGNYVPPIPSVFSPKQYLSKDEFDSAVDFGRELGLRVIT